MGQDRIDSPADDGEHGEDFATVHPDTLACGIGAPIDRDSGAEQGQSAGQREAAFKPELELPKREVTVEPAKRSVPVPKREPKKEGMLF